jgi:hypothetical protein
MVGGPFECELVLRENAAERRETRVFMGELGPGDRVRLEGEEWIVVLVNERPGSLPEVLCRLVSERR